MATAPIVAAGAGNIVATGGGNVLKGGSANIVAQGGGNVISGNGSAIVAQGAGNRRLLAEDDLKELPVAGAVVFARDPQTLALVPGLAPVRTDEQGRFRFSGVPSGATMLLEVVFVGEDRTATRMLAMAKAEAPGAKPITVSTASTLAAAQLCKVAEDGGNQGQIALMERPVIDALVAAMQTALSSDAATMREATKALAMAVPKSGDVPVQQQETDAFYQAATDQALAVTKKDAALAARAQEAQQTLTKPLDAAQQQAVAVLKPVALPSPIATAISPLTSVVANVVGASTAPTAQPTATTSASTAPAATASPAAGTSATPTPVATTGAATATTATPTPTAATPAPTAQPTPAPTPTPLLTVSIAPILPSVLPSVKISLPGLL